MKTNTIWRGKNKRPTCCLPPEMYAWGLSTRHIEAAFTDESGVCPLSRSAVSEVTEVLWEE